MKRALITSSIALLLLAANAKAGRYNRIVDFGESLSDTGNQWIASENVFPPSPPYYNGRWSNGPNWIDLVSARLGLGYAEPSLAGGSNYAFAGAASGPGEINVNCGNLGLLMCFDLPSPNYGTQIDDFLSSGSPIDANDLFVLWGGHNDISTGVAPQVAADNLTQHLTTLIDHGATDTVLLNLFETVEQNAKLNRLLVPSVKMLRQQHPEATIIDVDIPTMTNEFLRDPGKWGIIDYGTPALNTATLEVVDEPNKYLLWDRVHLTSAFNKVIADYVLRMMDPVLIRQGDFNGDDALTIEDVDALAAATRMPEVDLEYDLNFDGIVDSADLGRWVIEFRQTYFGDANLDGEFNSGDLMLVLAWGTYETGIESSWSTGDFNVDGFTDTGDLVFALADGGYEQGPRAAASAVPEPAGTLAWVMGMSALRMTRRQRRNVTYPCRR